MQKIEAFKIEAFKAQTPRLEALAAGAGGELWSASASAPIARPSSCCRWLPRLTAANRWAARLEDEAADLRTGRQAGGMTPAGAARRLGHLAAAIVGADRAARR